MAAAPRPGAPFACALATPPPPATTRHADATNHACTHPFHRHAGHHPPPPATPDTTRHALAATPRHQPPTPHPGSGCPPRATPWHQPRPPPPPATPSGPRRPPHPDSGRRRPPYPDSGRRRPPHPGSGRRWPPRPGAAPAGPPPATPPRCRCVFMIPITLLFYLRTIHRDHEANRRRGRPGPGFVFHVCHGGLVRNTCRMRPGLSTLSARQSGRGANAALLHERDLLRQPEKGSN
jgi:hypothetical protein